MALKDIHRVFTDAVQSPVSVTGWSRPKPWVKNWNQKAKDAMLKVLQEADPVKSGILVAAVFLLSRSEPRRFVTPRAFDYQLVRQWRGQVGIAFGSYWNHKLARVSHVYHYLPRRSTEEIARYVSTAYEKFVRFIVEADRKQVESLVPLM